MWSADAFPSVDEQYLGVPREGSVFVANDQNISN